MNKMDTSNQLDENQRKIKINFNNKVYHVTVTNDRLLQSTLDYNFPNAGRLMFLKGNEPMLLNVKVDNEEAHILLDSKVDEYYFEKYEEIKVSSKSSAYENMIATLKEKCQSYGTKKLSDKTKVMNKAQSVALKKADNLEEPYLKRVVYTSWKHRISLQDEFFSLGNRLAPKKKIELNGRINYSLEQLETELKLKYFDDSNRHYLEGSLSFLGNKEGKVITGFVDEKGNKCDFWEYCKLHRGSYNHSVHIIIFTTNFSDSQKDVKSSESYNIENSSIVKTDVLTSMKLTEQKKNSVNKDASNLSIVQAGVNSQVEKIQDNKNISHKDEIQKMSDDKEPLREIGNSNDSKLCVPESKHSELKSPSKKEDFISFTHSQSEEMTNASLPTTSKRLKVEGNFVAPKPKVKRSRAEIVQTLKMTISNVKSDDVKISSHVLGKGGQGVVRLGFYLGTKVAVKTMSNTTSERNFLREVQLLSELRHDNIVGIRGVSISDNESHIIMEYFDSVSLYDMVFKNKRDYFSLSLVVKNKIAYQIACAINYLHNLPTPVIHQDIKPANVLVDRNSKVKLCDFGLGRTEWLNEELESTCVNDTIRGTHFYMAPEVLVFGKKSTIQSDIWSLAATLVELYSEKQVWPMGEYRSTSTCAQVRMYNKETPSTIDVPPNLQTILTQCFSYDPSRRPSVQEIWSIIFDLKGCSDFNIA